MNRLTMTLNSNKFIWLWRQKLRFFFFLRFGTLPILFNVLHDSVLIFRDSTVSYYVKEVRKMFQTNIVNNYCPYNENTEWLLRRHQIDSKVTIDQHSWCTWDRTWIVKQLRCIQVAEAQFNSEIYMRRIFNVYLFDDTRNKTDNYRNPGADKIKVNDTLDNSRVGRDSLFCWL